MEASSPRPLNTLSQHDRSNRHLPQDDLGNARPWRSDTNVRFRTKPKLEGDPVDQVPQPCLASFLRDGLGILTSVGCGVWICFYAL